MKFILLACFLLLSPDAFSQQDGSRFQKILEIKKKRIVGMRQRNILLGIAPAIDIYEERLNDPSRTILTPGIELFAGYRTHFAKHTGYKLELQVQAGPTLAEYTEDYRPMGVGPDSPDIRSSSGSSGMTITSNLMGSIIIGPFWRISFDPGISLTWQAHSAKEVDLKGEAGNYRLSTPNNYLLTNLVIGSSLYFGDKYQYSYSFEEMVGVMPADIRGIHFYVRIGFAYAFQY